MLLSFPPHIHFVGQFWSQLNFVVQSSNIHTKCLIQDYRFWKAQNCVLMQKKWSGRLVRFLHFLFWLKACFLRLQPACKESSIFLLHHTIFSHFLSFETTFFKNVRKLCDEARKLSFPCKLVEAVKSTILIKTKNVRIWPSGRNTFLT